MPSQPPPPPVIPANAGILISIARIACVTPSNIIPNVILSAAKNLKPPLCNQRRHPVIPREGGGPRRPPFNPPTYSTSSSHGISSAVRHQSHRPPDAANSAVAVSLPHRLQKRSGVEESRHSSHVKGETTSGGSNTRRPHRPHASVISFSCRRGPASRARTPPAGRRATPPTACTARPAPL